MNNETYLRCVITIEMREDPAMCKRSMTYILIITVLLTAVLACNAPFMHDATEAPGSESPMPPAVLPSGAGDTTEIPVVELDPCSLLSRQQAENVLGIALTDEPAQQLMSCAYAGETFSMVVTAGQDEDAKDTIMVRLDLLLMFLPVDDALQQIEEMESLIETLSVSEMVQRSLPIYEAAGFVFQPLSEFGGETYWGWSEFGGGMLINVDGSTLISLTLIGMEEPAAREAAVSVLPMLVDGLPVRFTIPSSGTIEIPLTIPPLEGTE
jgi:hypothetical protein